MQRVLEKMARNLDEYDEASLMSLWPDYAATVQDFEPTKRWETAALALCLIQAVHWKNQLFNFNLALTANPAEKGELPPLPKFGFDKKPKLEADPAGVPGKKAKLLRFPGVGPAASKNP